jgi:hypothetical protein
MMPTSFRQKYGAPYRVNSRQRTSRNVFGRVQDLPKQLKQSNWAATVGAKMA